MAGNEVTLTIAGDATDFQRAAAQAEQSMTEVESAVADTNQAMEAGAQQSQDLGTRLGNLGNTVDGAATALQSVTDAVQSFADIQNMAAERAQRLGRALNDVKQAQEDYNQALLDGQQAQLDVGQAQIDQAQAMEDAAAAQQALTDAEREHGKGSAEARQAAIDLRQAQQDLAQAGYDVEQAMADQRQSTIDAEAAQLDLTDAMSEANPSGLQELANTLNMVMPLFTALISVVALATAAQWLWNIAMTANPIGLIIVAVAAIIAGIVLLATQVDWFGNMWKAVWEGIVAYFKFVLNFYKTAWDLIVTGAKWVIDKMSAIPGLIKSAFSNLFSIITAPWRAAFNFISDAWNNTVGRLSWTVPGWVPGVGGKSISAPRLPKFHDGGVVPGAPGSEMLAILQAGETVIPAKGGSGRTVTVIFGSDGTQVGDLLLEIVNGAVRRAGGADVAFGGSNG